VLDQGRRGIRVEFVKENLSFTGEDTPMSNLMLSVLGAVAQFEHDLIKERQREGIALAKQRGAYKGRKRALPVEQIAELRFRAGTGERKARLASEFGISRETLYKYLRMHDNTTTTPAADHSSPYRVRLAKPWRHRIA
jgi:DNA invertase Pin-like site-specific DNA recombinase